MKRSEVHGRGRKTSPTRCVRHVYRNCKPVDIVDPKWLMDSTKHLSRADVKTRILKPKSAYTYDVRIAQVKVKVYGVFSRYLISEVFRRCAVKKSHSFTRCLDVLPRTENVIAILSSQLEELKDWRKNLHLMTPLQVCLFESLEHRFVSK